MHPRAVHRDFELVLVLEPAHRPEIGAEEARLDDVFAVERHGRARQHAAHRANRQPLDVPILRRVLAYAEGFAGLADLRIADGHGTHPAGGRDVALEQQRRHAEHVGHVVEAVGGVVRGQQRGRVDVERQQVVNGVAVFGAVQAVHERPPGVGMRDGVGVERRRQRGDQRGAHRRLRCRHPLRRHHAHAHLADHLLPEVGGGAHVGEIGGLERQTRGLRVVVVTGHAVAIDRRAMRRGAGHGGDCGARRLRRAGRGRRARPHGCRRGRLLTCTGQAVESRPAGDGCARGNRQATEPARSSHAR